MLNIFHKYITTRVAKMYEEPGETINWPFSEIDSSQTIQIASGNTRNHGSLIKSKLEGNQQLDRRYLWFS